MIHKLLATLGLTITLALQAVAQVAGPVLPQLGVTPPGVTPRQFCAKTPDGKCWPFMSQDPVTGALSLPPPTLAQITSGLGFTPLNKAGDALLGDLKSAFSFQAKSTPTCTSADAHRPGNGLKLLVMDCLGVWSSGTVHGTDVYPTRGTGDDPSGVNGFAKQIDTQLLIQSQNVPTDNVVGHFGIATNFQSIGSAATQNANPQAGGVAHFISDNQMPGPNGERAPNVWMFNTDNAIAPNATSPTQSAIQNYDWEDDKNNYYASCDTGGVGNCLSIGIWFNGNSPFTNTAALYMAGAATTTFLGVATTSGATLTVPSTTFNLNTNAAQPSPGMVLSFGSTTGVLVGQYITGAGIAGLTTVAAVTPTSVTLSSPTAAAVANGTSITFASQNIPFTKDLTAISIGGANYHADWTDGTHAVLYPAPPTNASPLAFSGVTSLYYYGVLWGSGQSIETADFGVNDSAKWIVYAGGHHIFGLDTSSDTLVNALRMAAGQKVCFQYDDRCWSYSGGYMGFQQSSTGNAFAIDSLNGLILGGTLSVGGTATIGTLKTGTFTTDTTACSKAGYFIMQTVEGTSRKVPTCS